MERHEVRKGGSRERRQDGGVDMTDGGVDGMEKGREIVVSYNREYREGSGGNT